ncbi:MAG: SusC/RagA family TonB-linked outer membrane protein [Muribaculaceae bacterium]|nr:SusC/RagA family TonB-linked outer membrane protein [Muribaculaceae bacterium]
MKKRLLFLLTCLTLLTGVAMAKTVKGVVIDASDKEPVIGASVLVKGTQIGTSTNIDGEFTINNVPDNATTLVVSYVGMDTREVTITADKMTIELTANTTALDEVVVVAYGTASKESLTGSVAIVSDRDIERRPVTSVTQALEGMAPGVQVNGSTGTPGSSPSILIRGINSVNGTTAPLYVVDGVIWSGNYNDINPNDVENISVLKDAASCALYGSKGANGVVLITTKRGKGEGRVEVTAKVRQGIYQRALPEYRRLGYNDWNEAMLQGIVNGKVSTDKYTYEKAFEETVNNFFSEAGVLNLYGAAGKSPEDGSGSGAAVFDQYGKVVLNPLAAYNDTDWWKAISRNGYRQEYNVSGTGASEKFNIFASVGYVKEQGYLLKTDFERWSSRLRADFTPTNYLRVGMQLSGAYINSNQPQFDTDNLNSTSNAMSYQGTAPGLPYYLHNWETGELILDDNGQPIWNTTPGYSTFVSNKGLILRENDEYYSRISVDGNAYATILLPYGFDVTFRGTMNHYRQESTEYDSPVIGSAKDFGRLKKTFYNRQTVDISQIINWSHEYGLHHVDAMLNHESYNRYYDYTTAQNRDQLFPNNFYLNNFTENESTSAYAYRYRTETYMARGRYNWNNQYFFEASVSRDGSSKFAEDSRWGTFWSVGASWIINKEKFLRDVTQINNLKFRVAYGTAGNDYTSNYYPSYDLYSKYDHTLNGNPSVFPSTVGNPILRWESTNTLDLALEGYFFNSRLNASVGFFSRVNDNLLYNVSQAISNGTDGDGSAMSQWQNIGTMKNTGWEILIGGTIIDTRDLKWTAHVDATFIKNKITKLPAGNQYTSARALIEGKSRYEYYIPKWAGTDMLTGRSLYEINDCHKFQKEVIDEATGKGTGVWKLDDSEGGLWESNLTNAEKANALVKIGDRYYTTSTSFASNEFCGTSLPTVYGSFGTALSWKGLTFNALFTYSLGGKTLDTVYAGMLSPSAGRSIHEDAVKDMWTPEMANGITDENRINKNIRPQINQTYSNDNNSGSTSRFLVSSSYLAFKNLNLSYELPKRWLSPLKLKGLSAGLSIDNVCLVTARDGMNPTYSNAGGQGEYFVPSRVYSFEITARF